MREIKFRAYIKSENEMVDVVTLEFMFCEDYPSGWVACPWEQGFNESIDTHEKDCIFSMEEIELMQYTGLKDKNGKEIYEGDILGEDISDEVCYQVIWDNKNDLPNGFNLKATYPQYMFPHISYLKVLGNIYENPELLDKEV